ncbi:MAG: sulfotransferase family protein [Shimia sp.]
MTPRYVFVGGLHRSGTTLVARLITQHPEIGGIEGAPVPEQEGVYLQGAIPHTARDGTPGEYAYRPDLHLTETSPFNTAEVARRLHTDWDPWFPPAVPWRLEKSPVNLLRMRLYQQLFPTACFVVVTRHPLAVARATMKWSDRSEAQLLDHWAQAHRLVLSDLPFLHNVITVRYEDLCAQPGRQVARLVRFLDLDPAEMPRGSEPIFDGNPTYLSNDSCPPMPEAVAFGYTPQGIGDLPEAQACRHMLGHVRRAVAAE